MQRTICSDCWQPGFNCFCHMVEKVDPQIEFVILIHPIESRRRIATGRMAYLGLKNSYIVRGTDFASNPIINSLVEDANYQNVLLSPGINSVDVTNMTDQEKQTHFGGNKKLRVFVAPQFTMQFTV
mgnify:CR=1 FL=1